MRRVVRSNWMKPAFALGLSITLLPFLGCGGGMQDSLTKPKSGYGSITVGVIFPEDVAREIPGFTTQIDIAVSGLGLPEALSATATPAAPTASFTNVPEGKYFVLAWTNEDPDGIYPVYAAIADVSVASGQTTNVELELQPFGKKLRWGMVDVTYDALTATMLDENGNGGPLFALDGSDILIVGHRELISPLDGRQAPPTYTTVTFDPPVRIPAGIQPMQQLSPQDINVKDETGDVVRQERFFIRLRGVYGVKVPAGTFPSCAVLEIASNPIDDTSEPGDLHVLWLARDFGIVQMMWMETPPLADLSRLFGRQGGAPTPASIQIGGVSVLTTGSANGVTASQSSPVTFTAQAYDGNITSYLPLTDGNIYELDEIRGPSGGIGVTGQ